ncbi:hypothetical protein ACFX13_008809 [Malus domestica]
MAERNHNHLDQLVLHLKTSRILVQGKHRWLRPDEICELLRNPNGITISEEPTNMPLSGSILFFDRKVQRHFRKDGYKWKKAKDGKIVKEAHERLKVGGVDTLHCYYAHGEEDENFQRRSYWMLEEKLSHIVLVHYRDVKGDKIKVRYIKATAEGVQRSRETDEITPKSEIDSFASSSLNPSNFQHSQATDGTHLNSGQTAQSKNTDSACTHQASSGLPPVPELQHAVAEINAGFLDTSYPLTLTNCKEREVEEAVSLYLIPTNLQMRSQAIDTASLSSVYASDFEDAQSAYSMADDFDWESFCNNVTTFAGTGTAIPRLIQVTCSIVSFSIVFVNGSGSSLEQRVRILLTKPVGPLKFYLTATNRGFFKSYNNCNCWIKFQRSDGFGQEDPHRLLRRRS